MCAPNEKSQIAPRAFIRHLPDRLRVLIFRVVPIRINLLYNRKRFPVVVKLYIYRVTFSGRNPRGSRTPASTTNRAIRCRPLVATRARRRSRGAATASRRSGQSGLLKAVDRWRAIASHVRRRRRRASRVATRCSVSSRPRW